MEISSPSAWLYLIGAQKPYPEAAVPARICRSNGRADIEIEIKISFSVSIFFFVIIYLTLLMQHAAQLGNLLLDKKILFFWTEQLNLISFSTFWKMQWFSHTHTHTQKKEEMEKFMVI